jgi:tetratricopeptide (TPR) repeat protein
MVAEIASAELGEVRAAFDEDHYAVAYRLLLRIRAERGLRPSEQFRLADCLRLLGRVREALLEFSAIDLAGVSSDKQSGVRVHHGQAFLDAGRYEEAAECLRAAVEKDPESTLPYFYLAIAYMKREEWDLACGVLREGLAAEGDRDELYWKLGQCLRALDRWEEARDCFAKALELTPDYAEAKLALEDIEAALRIEFQLTETL